VLLKVVLSTLAFTAFELPPNGAIGTKILEFLFHSRPDLVRTLFSRHPMWSPFFTTIVLLFTIWTWILWHGLLTRELSFCVLPWIIFTVNNIINYILDHKNLHGSLNMSYVHSSHYEVEKKEYKGYTFCQIMTIYIAVTRVRLAFLVCLKRFEWYALFIKKKKKYKTLLTTLWFAQLVGNCICRFMSDLKMIHHLFSLSLSLSLSRVSWSNWGGHTDGGFGFLIVYTNGSNIVHYRCYSQCR
jgi:hypothetical protein